MGGLSEHEAGRPGMRGEGTTGSARPAMADYLPPSARPEATCGSRAGGGAWTCAVTISGWVRRECFDTLRSRIAAGVRAGELPPSADVDRYARFYLGIMQAMAIQAKDGASRQDLLGLVEAAMATWPSP